MIAAERARQVSKEGWTTEHDDGHHPGELALAAACYAIPEGRRVPIGMKVPGNPPALWPWEIDWWKPTPNDRIRELVKAGALIAAEIELLQRLARKEPA